MCLKSWYDKFNMWLDGQEIHPLWLTVRDKQF